jgi:16S rRNA (cytidine1402-2'-O)-methyltransferase
MKEQGKLYLIPNVIAEDTQSLVVATQVTQALQNINYFLAEEIRTARRYLSSLKIYASIEALHFEVLNKETKEEQIDLLMSPLMQGFNMGVISESGCPGVADPGALAVKYAHEKNIQVVPLVGPSSILLALMASGLNGQEFAFHGYLPIEGKEAAKKIKELEKESKLKSQTKIFIETPYRNNSIFETLIKNLNPETRVSIALDLTGKEEFIKTKTVAQWKKAQESWPKTPMVFSFLA